MAVTMVSKGATGVELSIAQERSGLTVRGYTSVLREVLGSLEAIDRLVVRTRSPRLTWIIGDVSANGSVRATLVPRPVAPSRPAATAERAPYALAHGVGALLQEPAIPEYFSEDVVRRVQRVGEKVGSEGISGITVGAVRLGKIVTSSELTRDTAINAGQAVLPVSSAQSSVSGVLNLLSVKREKLRAVIEEEKSHLSVVCEIDAVPKGQVRELWGERVTAWGSLTRNTRGQPIRLTVEGLELASADAARPPRLTARQLLGIAPNWTGELTTQEYMDQMRRRA